MMGRNSIKESSKDIEIISKVDVLVVGGGPSGVCAAVAAARAGAKTFLLERYGFLGGMWTAGLVITLAGYNNWLKPYQRCVSGIPEEWIRRAKSLDGAEDNESWALNSDPEVMKLVADEMIAEANVDCLLHTLATFPIMEGNKIVGVIVENTDGRKAILANITIDCTGNGDIIARSGAKFIKGETLQPMTVPFRIADVKPPSKININDPVTLPIGTEPGFLREPMLSKYASRRLDIDCDREAMHKEKKAGNLPVFGGPWFGGLEKNIVWVNTTRIIGDATKAYELTRAEIEGRRNVFSMMSYFKENLEGFENSYLLQTSTQVGIRETRRMIGMYTLTGENIQTNTPFYDSIAVGCWPIDIHPADQASGVHEMYVPSPYQIPYRSLVSENIQNLIAAGRCISVDREAMGSVRVGATCGATGQAAGVAAYVASKTNSLPSLIDHKRVRNILQDQGAIIDPPK